MILDVLTYPNKKLYAYLSEIIRGAFLAVDRGQIEAAKSINLSRMQTLRLIVIPQAIPVAVPGIVNILIDAIKGSSLAFTIGILDITAVGKKCKKSSQFKRGILILIQKSSV